MTIKDMTLSDAQRLNAEADGVEVVFEMDEETFRAFYERTARPLHGYLSRMTGDTSLADDLLQESYYRFLRARTRWDSEMHRRAYLFRIATNLVRDGHRRTRLGASLELPQAEHPAMSSNGDLAERSAVRTDLHRAMAKLRPRDRALLWLAYARGHPHVEIAQTLGVKPGSIKLLLFRARKRLAGLLRGAHREETSGTR
jgi:RNA polymerase sigma-70 factor (ECF subfamily)